LQALHELLAYELHVRQFKQDIGMTWIGQSAPAGEVVATQHGPYLLTGRG
jgi:hypothetical protein